MKKILLVNGPNLNLLGTREPDVYGSDTLADIEAGFSKRCAEAGVECHMIQSNHEGHLIDFIHKYRDASGLVINPAGLSHTSVSLRDAILATRLRTIEVHITNIYAREPFRHHSYVSAVAEAVIGGLGTAGYFFALDHLLGNKSKA